jgi:hypothetical protein
MLTLYERKIICCIWRRSSYRAVNTPVRLQKTTHILLYGNKMSPFVLKSTKKHKFTEWVDRKFFLVFNCVLCTATAGPSNIKWIFRERGGREREGEREGGVCVRPWALSVDDAPKFEPLCTDTTLLAKMCIACFGSPLHLRCYPRSTSPVLGKLSLYDLRNKSGHVSMRAVWIGH